MQVRHLRDVRQLDLNARMHDSRIGRPTTAAGKTWTSTRRIARCRKEFVRHETLPRQLTKERGCRVRGEESTVCRVCKYAEYGNSMQSTGMQYVLYVCMYCMYVLYVCMYVCMYYIQSRGSEVRSMTRRQRRDTSRDCHVCLSLSLSLSAVCTV